MRRLLIASLFATSLLTCHAETVRASGKVIEQSRSVGDFESIRSEGAWSMDVRVGPATSVKLIADENYLPQIETVVEKGELRVRFKEHQSLTFGRKSELRIEITVPKLSAYHHEGAGQTAFHDLSGERFALDYEGVGHVTATGKVDNLAVQASGAGALDMSHLQARNASVSLEGIGSVSVYASDALTASVDGIGSLTYYGRPAKLSKSVSGIGSVRAGD